MARVRRPIHALLSFTVAGCVQLPEAPEGLVPFELDGSIVAELAADGGGGRPPTGEPYRGPECEPQSAPDALAMDAGGSGAAPPDPGADAATFGASDGESRTAARRPAVEGEVVITEVMSDPAAVRDDAGEWFELHNPSADRVLELSECVVDDGSASPRNLRGPLQLAPLGFAAVARGQDAGFVPDHAMSFSLGNTADVLALVCDGVVIDRVAYGPGFPLAPGASMALDPDATDAVSNDDPSVWCLSQAAYGADRGTPAAPNQDCEDGDADADAGAG